MFSKKEKAQQLACDLNCVYFEIKCQENELHYLEIYLKEKGFERDFGFENKILGSHIIQWREPHQNYNIANLKHNPNNDYQLLVQFNNVKKPLAKRSKTRKFLEEILDITKTTTLNCGYIHELKGTVFCNYDDKNFSVDEKTLNRYYKNNTNKTTSTLSVCQNRI
jgi:hypothetical protein